MLSGRNIWAPPYVVQTTAEAWQDDNEKVEEPQAGLITNTCKACTTVDADFAKEVRASYRGKIGGALKDASSKLRELDFTLDVPQSTKRICTYSSDAGRKTSVKFE